MLVLLISLKSIIQGNTDEGLFFITHFQNEHGSFKLDHSVWENVATIAHSYTTRSTQ